MPHVSAASVTPDDLVGAVRTGLAALADPAKAGPMQAYMRSAMPYRGVTARPLARFCRELFDQKRLLDRESRVNVWFLAQTEIEFLRLEVALKDLQLGQPGVGKKEVLERKE